MERKKPIVVRLDAEDDVAVALTDLDPGIASGIPGLACREPVPSGHKVAVRKIDAGDKIRKYGQVIGIASRIIQPGEHVHTHNLEMGDFARDYAIGSDTRLTDLIPEQERATFSGIIHPDGRVGTRNYIGVLATVNCSAGVARFIADSFNGDILSGFPNVDGVVSLGHGTGCGMITDGEGFRLLQRTLAGYTRHPNFSGIVMVGLGCEVNQVDCLLENTHLKNGPHMRTINIQEAGGTRETVRKGVEAVKKMLHRANKLERSTVPASHISLGLECGGSDAYSGISANPALGVAADLLVRNGGTAILSETPEIYGAEHLLTRRAVNREAGEKLVRRVLWWEKYTSSLGGDINNNPTPGNKAGGLTTILEKLGWRV